MRDYQSDFLELALEHQVLSFGSFTLKSGRISPYFFNLGRISSGAAMLRLARAYASAITDSNLQFDLLFGPAYKGIPLVTAVACALANAGRDLPYTYNRKEAKDHGEGGVLVGADIRDQRVLIIDDVLTAGTALRESCALIERAGGRPIAAITALDRQEIGPNGRSAVAETTETLGISLISLVTVQDLLDYLGRRADAAGTVQAIRDYQGRYGTA